MMTIIMMMIIIIMMMIIINMMMIMLIIAYTLKGHWILKTFVFEQWHLLCLNN